MHFFVPSMHQALKFPHLIRRIQIIADRILLFCLPISFFIFSFFLSLVLCFSFFLSFFLSFFFSFFLSFLMSGSCTFLAVCSQAWRGQLSTRNKRKNCNCAYQVCPTLLLINISSLYCRFLRGPYV
jgi:hypothetical protein